jgi:adenosine deaminase
MTSCPARAAGLPTSVHCAEVSNDAEMDQVIAFRPARLGHALLLSAKHIAALRAAPIPIELCPSSNLMTLRKTHMRDHPTATRWLVDELRANLDAPPHPYYPVSINTDDSSVFGTSASAELARVAIELGLDARHVVHLATRALDDAFDRTPGVVAELRARFAREASAALELYRAELAIGPGLC